MLLPYAQAYALWRNTGGIELCALAGCHAPVERLQIFENWNRLILRRVDRPGCLFGERLENRFIRFPVADNPARCFHRPTPFAVDRSSNLVPSSWTGRHSLIARPVNSPW